jgi:hypothetical protein
MADNEGSSVGIVAIIAIVILILVVGVFLYRSGGLGGSKNSGASINVQVPGVGGGSGETGGTGGTNP